MLVRKASGRKEKLKKCFIVQLFAKFSNHVVETIKMWLIVLVPDWAAISIVDAFADLGIYLGPGAAKRQWDAPKKKVESRLASLQLDQESVTQSIIRYRVTLIACLLCKVQVLDVPADLFSEHRIFVIVAKLPCKTFSLDAVGSFHTLGFPVFHRIVH